MPLQIPKRTSDPGRVRCASGAISIALLYVGFAVYCKPRMNSEATMTTSAPFNCMLWYCIKKTDSSYYTGYASVFDKSRVIYEYHPKSWFLLRQPEPYLTAFADGYYTVSKTGDKLYFNILRFGQIHGWQQNEAPFVLSYPLQNNGGENMIIQKGRLTGWNAKTIKQYMERIEGK